MSNEANSEKEPEGLEQVFNLFGEAYVRDRLTRWEQKVDRQFSEALTAFTWKGLYTRKVLEPKVRQLCVISGPTVLNALPQLKGHIKAAFRAGASEAEIKEAIIQMSVYCGMPYMNQAFEVYEEVAQELQKT